MEWLVAQFVKHHQKMDDLYSFMDGMKQYRSGQNEYFSMHREQGCIYQMADGSNLSNKHQSTKKDGIRLLSHTQYGTCVDFIYTVYTIRPSPFQQLTLDFMEHFVTFCQQKMGILPQKTGFWNGRAGAHAFARWSRT